MASKKANLKHKHKRISSADRKLLKESHQRLMENMRSLLSVMVSFSLPAIIAFTSIDSEKWASVSDEEKLTIGSIFHVTGFLCFCAVITSHATTDPSKWSLLVSFLTRLVCIGTMCIFTFSMDFFSPEKYIFECTLLKIVLFGSVLLYIAFVWEKQFGIPQLGPTH